MHDPRVGRFFATDPLEAEYPWYTPYQFSGNKVIAFKELEGKEETWAIVNNEIVRAGPAATYYTSYEAAAKVLEKQRANMSRTPTLVQDNRTYEQKKEWHNKVQMQMNEVEIQKQYYANPTNMIAHGVAIGVPELVLDLATEGAFSYARTSKIFMRISNSKLALKTGGVLDGIISASYKSDFAQHLKSIINANGSPTNCVACSIEFQKKTMNRLYGTAKSGGVYGLDDYQIASSLYENFSDYKTFTSGGKVTELSSALTNKLVNTQSSAIVVGTLKNQSKFKAHAFNAVKGADGQWNFLDLQNGVEYNAKAMEKTFTNYKIYDVK